MCAIELALPEVLGVVDRDNAPSRRVLDKAGFVVASDEGARIVYRRAERNGSGLRRGIEP